MVRKGGRRSIIAAIVIVLIVLGAGVYALWFYGDNKTNEFFTQLQENMPPGMTLTYASKEIDPTKVGIVLKNLVFDDKNSGSHLTADEVVLSKPSLNAEGKIERLDIATKNLQLSQKSAIGSSVVRFDEFAAQSVPLTFYADLPGMNKNPINPDMLSRFSIGNITFRNMFVDASENTRKPYSMKAQSFTMKGLKDGVTGGIELAGLEIINPPGESQEGNFRMDSFSLGSVNMQDIALLLGTINHDNDLITYIATLANMPMEMKGVTFIDMDGKTSFDRFAVKDITANKGHAVPLKMTISMEGLKTSFRDIPRELSSLFIDSNGDPVPQNILYSHDYNVDTKTLAGHMTFGQKGVGNLSLSMDFNNVSLRALNEIADSRGELMDNIEFPRLKIVFEARKGFTKILDRIIKDNNGQSREDLVRQLNRPEVRV